MSRLDDRIRTCLEIGTREHARGAVEAALASYKQALDWMPDHPHANALYGAALLQIGEAASALRHLETAAQTRRNDPWLLGHLAQAYFSASRFAEAGEAFRKASRLDPRNGQHQLGIANSLAMQGKLSDAETLLRKLCDRYPHQALIWFNLGNVLRNQRKPDEALQCYAKALDIDPAFIDARISLGSVLHSQLRFAEAEREYRASLRLYPQHIPAQINLVSVLIDVGDFRAAEAACRSLVAHTPQLALGHTFLGAALDHQGKVLDALECHRTAVALAPEDQSIVENYAVALAHADQFEAAFDAFSRALALNPGSASVLYARATTLLACGRLDEGWRDYAHRPAFLSFCQTHAHIRLSRQLPNPLKGANITLLSEQGLGDELFLLRFAMPLRAAGARVVYRTNSKLRSLLARVDGLTEAVDDAQMPPPDDDTVMLIGDLPHALLLVNADTACSNAPTPPHTGDPFDRSASDSKGFAPSLTLTPRADAIDAVRERLSAFGPPPYFAVTWRGGTPPREQVGSSWALYKSIQVAQLATALRNIPCSVVVIQRNLQDTELQAFRSALGRNAQDFSDANDDLELMTGLLSLVDDYIGVSNTNMHLRAAVGRSARVLVPCPAEWRWMAAGAASPWFPSFSIYRQSLAGEWDDALDSLERDLGTAWR